MPKIIKCEAEIVRRIYRMFLSGKAPCMIARLLTEERIPTPAGKKKWQSSTVLSILTNEKYKGADLLQKKFTVGFLTKKMKINEGEIPQYYVENSHKPIILPVEFDFVQNEIARRKAIGKGYSGKSVFSTNLYVVTVGSTSVQRYGRAIQNTGKPYGSVTASLRVIIFAQHHILPKMR